MGLEDDLAKLRAEFEQKTPPGRAALYDAKVEELRARFPFDRVVGVGMRAPDFCLPDARGPLFSLAEALCSGPAIVTFYRGGWCPYCNLQLRAYQSILREIRDLGAQLIAISPEMPDQSLTTSQKNALGFPVLSDAGNAVARSFGIVYAVDEALREIMRANNKALPAINGDNSWDLPLPATFVIAPNGVVMLAFVEADYRSRLAPDLLLDSLRALRPAAASTAVERPITSPQR